MKRNREFIATFFIWLVPILMTAFFIWLMFDVVKFGLKDWNWSFLFEESISAGRKGGIGPILVSTGLILGVCLLVTVPIGMGTAILLAQYSLQNVFLTKWTRRSLDVLSGVPSIVFGLFGNAFFCKTLGLGFSILSGGLTLACMALPLMIRSTEEGFRSIPSEYKMGIEALGFSKWTGIRKILLPLAVPGLVVGLVLGIGLRARFAALRNICPSVSSTHKKSRDSQMPLDPGSTMVDE
ncbi:MAG: PstA family ABC transporter permease, partial [Elusimicrobiota bacterium]